MDRKEQRERVTVCTEHTKQRTSSIMETKKIAMERKIDIGAVRP